MGAVFSKSASLKMKQGRAGMLGMKVAGLLGCCGWVVAVPLDPQDRMLQHSLKGRSVGGKAK